MGEWKRIARSKSKLVGCVTQIEIRESRSRGGYIVVRTTATGSFWLMVPSHIFRHWADQLRTPKQRLRTPYTRVDAENVKHWLRTKMIEFEYAVMVGDGAINYQGIVKGLMEGES
jgi:hypothetical protein